MYYPVYISLSLKLNVFASQSKGMFPVQLGRRNEALGSSFQVSRPCVAAKNMGDIYLLCYLFCRCQVSRVAVPLVRSFPTSGVYTPSPLFSSLTARRGHRSALRSRKGNMLSPRSSNYDRIEGGMGPSRGYPAKQKFAWKKFAVGAAVIIGLVWIFGPRERRHMPSWVSDSTAEFEESRTFLAFLTRVYLKFETDTKTPWSPFKTRDDQPAYSSCSAKQSKQTATPLSARRRRRQARVL